MNLDDLLTWLRERRDQANVEFDEWNDQDGLDSWEAAVCKGRGEAFTEAIQHIQYGGPS